MIDLSDYGLMVGAFRANFREWAGLSLFYFDLLSLAYTISMPSLAISDRDFPVLLQQ